MQESNQTVMPFLLCLLFLCTVSSDLLFRFLPSFWVRSWTTPSCSLRFYWVHLDRQRRRRGKACLWFVVRKSMRDNKKPIKKSFCHILSAWNSSDWFLLDSSSSICLIAKWWLKLQITSVWGNQMSIQWHNNNNTRVLWKMDRATTNMLQVVEQLHNLGCGLGIMVLLPMWTKIR